MNGVPRLVSSTMPDAESIADTDVPSVDELEARMQDVDAAMALLQAGDLDAAEAAIASLEQRIGLRSD